MEGWEEKMRKEIFKKSLCPELLILNHKRELLIIKS